MEAGWLEELVGDDPALSRFREIVASEIAIEARLPRARNDEDQLTYRGKAA